VSLVCVCDVFVSQDDTANAMLKRVEQWVAAAGVKPYNDKSGEVGGAVWC
jgi:hypothetical protein